MQPLVSQPWCSTRGVAVDHTTLYRWTQRYAPELEKRSAWYRSRLSRLIKPTLGFQSMKTAYATLKGFEVMRMLKKGQFKQWIEAVGGGTEASFVNRLFGVYA